MKAKERLYISDIIENPVISYPAYYLLSKSLINNELLHSTIEAIHLYEFSQYKIPKDYKEIFNVLNSRGFAIYKEKYAIGYFGGRVMYLESYGWKSLNATEDIFDFENWLIEE
jgi:hypothetical protein